MHNFIKKEYILIIEHVYVNDWTCADVKKWKKNSISISIILYGHGFCHFDFVWFDISINLIKNFEGSFNIQPKC